MKTIYNIEDFVIEELFLPYNYLLFPDPQESDISKIEKELRKNPEKIFSILVQNQEAFDLTFDRLAKTNFKFYKWLRHPIIDTINNIVNGRQKRLFISEENVGQ